MTTINKTDKVALVTAFVFSKIETRLRNLRDEAVDHYLSIVNEVYTPDAVRSMNEVVHIIANNLEVARVVMDVSIYGSNPISQNDVKIIELTKIVTGDDDPFDVNSGFLMRLVDEHDLRHTMSERVNDLWQEITIPDVELSVPLLRFTEEENEDGSSCSIDDREDAYNIELINRLSVTDCTTSRRFDKTYTAIEKDAGKLFNSIYNVIKTCRSEQAVLNKVPQLEVFINTHESSIDELDAMIAAAEQA